MENKFYARKKEINGTTYTAQFSGLALAMRAVDQSYIEDSKNTSVEKLAEFILENVIVEPRKKINDFDSMDELNEVIKFGQGVMQGKFRDEKKLPGTKGKSEP